MVKYLFLLFTLISFSANALPNVYRVMPGQSSIGFEAVQNDSPVAGKLNILTGIINFDPNDLGHSNAKISIDMENVVADYAEIPRTLKGQEWFDSATFNAAEFDTISITSNDNKNYVAEGTLTLKGISLPVTLHFTLTSFGPDKASAEGTASISRTKYNIGWADVSSVKDLVKIKFKVAAENARPIK